MEDELYRALLAAVEEDSQRSSVIEGRRGGVVPYEVEELMMKIRRRQTAGAPVKEKRLIDAWQAIGVLRTLRNRKHRRTAGSIDEAMMILSSPSYTPTVDAVEVETLKSWLYEMAMNNSVNMLGDACQEIIDRIEAGGLARFIKDRSGEE